MSDNKVWAVLEHEGLDGFDVQARSSMLNATCKLDIEYRWVGYNYNCRLLWIADQSATVNYNKM